MKITVEETDRIIVSYDPGIEDGGILKVLEVSDYSTFYLIWSFPDLPNRPAHTMVMWRDEELVKVLHKFAEEVADYEVDKVIIGQHIPAPS